MTTTYHTPIASGAAANSAVVNAPLATLDAQIVANTAAIGDAVADIGTLTNLTTADKTNLVAAINEIDVDATAAAATVTEVVTARDSYASLDARLDAITISSGFAATLTNGAANAAQKVVNVDSTTGFLVGAAVVYALVGGAYQQNTVAVVNSATQLTMTTNIGTGGIADNTYLSVTPPGVITQVSDPAYVGGTVISEGLAANITDATRDLIALLEEFNDRELRSVTLQYVDASTMYVWLGIAPLYWLRVQIDLVNSEAWVPGEQQVFRVYQATDDRDAGITYSGTSWLQQDAQAGAIEGTRTYAFDNTQYLEFSFTGHRELYIAFQVNALGGYVKPIIDGSQDLVKQHCTLIGADYVFSTFTDISNPYFKLIADNLDPNRTYAIRLETKGIPPGGTDDRFYFDAYAVAPVRYDEAVILTNTTRREETPVTSDTGWAISFAPSGYSAELAGSRHNNVAAGSTAWRNRLGDDMEATAAMSMKTADKLVFLQTEYLRHSQTSTTNHAEIKTRIIFSTNKITWRMHFDWLTACTVGYGYFGMLPLVIDRAKFAGYPTIHEPGGNTGARLGEVKSTGAITWHSTDNPYVFSYTTNSVDFMLRNGGELEVSDGSGGGKLYPQLVGAVSVGAGDTWDIEWTWWVHQIEDVEELLLP